MCAFEEIQQHRIRSVFPLKYRKFFGECNDQALTFAQIASLDEPVPAYFSATFAKIAYLRV